ncbi:hypothetical protein ACN20G_37060 (plasmid) [Streptomyces sp. BI20]|uniref:hypothetical protein n=1 Tax=Streptomyces sp. BI20 TaxID=3403460 RepID=UPI003C780A87
MTAKTGFLAKLFRKPDTPAPTPAPASDCCDVRIVEEDGITVEPATTPRRDHGN